LLYQLSQEGNLALLNQGMNGNCAGSRAKVSLALGFKNTRKEDSYLKSATPEIYLNGGSIKDVLHLFYCGNIDQTKQTLSIISSTTTIQLTLIF